MTRAALEPINGVPYPIDVCDEKSFLQWISSIDRPSQATPLDPESPKYVYREVYRYAYFCDNITRTHAVSMVCQQMAMSLFAHLIKAPHAKIVWRIRPEFDVSSDTIPSDLSLVMHRDQIDASLQGNAPISLDEVRHRLGKEDWASDFVTDTIFPVAAPRGVWKIFKSYMRYAAVLDSCVVSHPIEIVR